ncbi:MAG TPA: XRE family transcriptional regulator [Erysipelothrix sp.]|nr:XRE family transcriptional regulator [Erysipelothrix sp.]
MEIGRKIKHLRIKNGLTIEDLAGRTELSKGFISQIENDLTSPSIATLSDIVEVLGVDLSSFFKNDTSKQFIYTQDDFYIDEKEAYTTHWIVPNSSVNEMEPILLVLNPNASSFEIEPHDGEEFGYVLEGEVSLLINNESYELKKGHTFYLSSHKTHTLQNKTNKKAKVLWVSTPPIF